jgi:hypothetical protein
MATLHYGSKKNLEFEGETYDAPKFTAKQMQKANDARQWVLIYKHILSCDELTQIELFIKNIFNKKYIGIKNCKKMLKAKNGRETQNQKDDPMISLMTPVFIAKKKITP